jgi:hypothetical protein
VRFATVVTEDGLRLHVRGRSGYVDVGKASGDERLSSLQAVLEGGAEVTEAVRRTAEHDGRELAESDYGPAVPAPRRVLCFGVNYLEHALEGGRPPTKWPETFVRGASATISPDWFKSVSAALGASTLASTFVADNLVTETSGPAFEAFSKAIFAEKGKVGSTGDFSTYLTAPGAVHLYDGINLAALAMVAAKSTSPAVYGPWIIS